MSVFKARITVTLKPEVLDPQGQAIEGALKSLSFDGVTSVRQGKVFDLELSAANLQQAEDTVTAMCEKLLANMIIEDYTLDLEMV